MSKFNLSIASLFISLNMSAFFILLSALDIVLALTKPVPCDNLSTMALYNRVRESPCSLLALNCIASISLCCFINCFM